MLNIKPTGEILGATDAGQSWRTGMTYSKTIGFVNVLSAFKAPMRDGRAPGGAEFTNTQAAAAADLSADMLERLNGLTATRDIEYYWEYMRREKGSQRPPVHHPVLLDKYHYVYEWTVGDPPLWDHIGAWHYARPDYGPDEPRLMKRCQVMATKIFDPAFGAMA